MIKSAIIATCLAGASLATAMPAQAAVFVDANSLGTSIGTVVANQQYLITVTGIVDMAGGATPGGSFNLDANGVPVTSVTYPGYAYFNPGGSTIADGVSGPLPGKNFGALIGTFGGVGTFNGPNPTYFFIGSSLATSFSQSGEIFARINDINANNSGGFSVSLSAVPEPATWAMMLMGFAMVGVGLRRRAKTTVRITYA